MTTVPNQFPEFDPTPGSARIAIVGEAPGSSEISRGIPFCGASGWHLDRWLESRGIPRSSCFVGNVCQHQPPGNDLRLFPWDGPEIQAGVAALVADLSTFRPTMVLCLGNAALHLAKSGNIAPSWTPKSGHRWPDSVLNWRGSLFWSAFLGVKAMATIHPAAALRTWEWSALIRADLGRLAREAKNPELVVPKTDVQAARDGAQAWALLETLSDAVRNGDRRLQSWDIEGGVNGVTSIAWSLHPTEATVVAFSGVDGTPLMSTEEELACWELLQEILESPAPKVFHNAPYDVFVLAWSYGIHVANIAEDSMWKSWEWRCELPKDLGTVTSLWTRHAYHKDARESEDLGARLVYNGLDAARTLEIVRNMDAAHALDPGQVRDYQFRVRMIVPFLYMSLRGFKYDKEGARTMRAEALAKARAVQHEINTLAGLEMPSTLDGWIAFAAKALCAAKPRRRWRESIFQPTRVDTGKKSGKRLPASELPANPSDNIRYVYIGEGAFSAPAAISTPGDIVTYAKESCREGAERASATLKKVPLGSLPTSDLPDLLGLSINVNSTNAGGACQRLLYDVWNLPRQFKREEGRPTDKLTTDDAALLAIYAQTKDLRPIKVLALRRLLTAAENLDAEVDPDGRIRCGLSVVGPKTGRTACYESPTGSGYNLQTVTKKHRRLFLADPGCAMIERDLEGADSWTVAAWANKLGDDAMLEDLRAGIKPHAMVVLMNEMGTKANLLTREELRPLIKAKVDKDGWLYAAGKKVSHMSNYLGKGRTMSESILSDSCKDLPEDLATFSPLFVPPDECDRLQKSCYFARYWGVLEWHDHWKRILRGDGEFVSACGAHRMFLGKRLEPGGKVDRKTHGDAVAHEPQHNTTLAALLAIWKLWMDPENRRSEEDALAIDAKSPTIVLVCEPLLTVHDSVNLETPIPHLDASLARAKIWFDNPLPIAGQTITIPMDGKVGRDWGMTPLTS